MSTTGLSPSDLLQFEHVHRALAESDAPQSADWIVRHLPGTLHADRALVERHLLEAVDRGEIWRFGKVRGAFTFWNRTPEVWVARELQQRARSGLHTRAELVQSVVRLALLRDVLSKKAVETCFTTLVQNGGLRACPSFLGSRTVLFTVGEPDPKPYLRHAVDKLRQKLSLKPSQLASVLCELADELEDGTSSRVSPLPQPSAPTVSAIDANAGHELSDDILQAIVEINPRAATGDIVLLAELRKRFDFKLAKHEFDRALCRLAEQFRISLHKYDHTGWMTDAERHDFVRDESGNFYNVVSLRNDGGAAS